MDAPRGVLQQWEFTPEEEKKMARFNLVFGFVAIFGFLATMTLHSAQAGGGCPIFAGVQTAPIDGGCLFQSPDGQVRTDKVPNGWYAIFGNPVMRAESGISITVTQASFYPNEQPTATTTPTATPTSSTALPQPWENLRQQVAQWCSFSTPTEAWSACNVGELQFVKGEKPNELLIKVGCASPSRECGKLDIPVKNSSREEIGRFNAVLYNHGPIYLRQENKMVWKADLTSCPRDTNEVSAIGGLVSKWAFKDNAWIYSDPGKPVMFTFPGFGKLQSWEGGKDVEFKPGDPVDSLVFNDAATYRCENRLFVPAVFAPALPPTRPGSDVVLLLVKDPADWRKVKCEQRDVAWLCSSSEGSVTWTHPGRGLQVDYWVKAPEPTNAAGCDISVNGDTRIVKCPNPGAQIVAENVTYRPKVEPVVNPTPDGSGCPVFGATQTKPTADGGCLFVSPDANPRTDTIPQGWWAFTGNPPTRVDSGSLTVTQVTFYRK